jgi:hypothetical protein
LAAHIDRHQDLDLARITAFADLEQDGLQRAALARAINRELFAVFFQVDRVVQEIVIGQAGGQDFGQRITQVLGLGGGDGVTGRPGSQGSAALAASATTPSKSG